MISKKFVWFVMAMGVLLALSVPAEAQQRRGGGGRSSGSVGRNAGGNRDGGNVGTRSSGGSRSYAVPRDGGRSYNGPAVSRRPMPTAPRSYQGGGRSVGGNRSYGSPVGRSSYGSYNRQSSFVRPFIGRSYYRRGDWYGYYGNGLFVPVYDQMSWQSMAAYATMVAADTWMFRQRVPDVSYGYESSQAAPYEYDQYGQPAVPQSFDRQNSVPSVQNQNQSVSVVVSPEFQTPAQGEMAVAQPVQMSSPSVRSMSSPATAPSARQAVQSSTPSRMEIEEACKKDGNMPVRNDTGVKVRATSTSAKGTFEFDAGDSACVEYKDGAQMHFQRVDYYGNGRIDGQLRLADSPICLERDNHEVLHLRNTCQQK